MHYVRLFQVHGSNLATVYEKMEQFAIMWQRWKWKEERFNNQTHHIHSIDDAMKIIISSLMNDLLTTFARVIIVELKFDLFFLAHLLLIMTMTQNWHNFLYTRD